MSIADDAEGARGTKNGASLMIADVHEDIRRKERTQYLTPLAILPDLLNLVGRHKRFDLPNVEHAAEGLLALGHGVDREPTHGLFRISESRRQCSGYI